MKVLDLPLKGKWYDMIAKRRSLQKGIRRNQGFYALCFWLQIPR